MRTSEKRRCYVRRRFKIEEVFVKYVSELRGTTSKDTENENSKSNPKGIPASKSSLTVTMRYVKRIIMTTYWQERMRLRTK
jgi:hypothetical protein